MAIEGAKPDRFHNLHGVEKVAPVKQKTVQQDANSVAAAISNTLESLFEAIEGGSLKATHEMLEQIDVMTKKYNELAKLLGSIAKGDGDAQVIVDRLPTLIADLRKDIDRIKEPDEDRDVAGVDGAADIRQKLNEQLDGVEGLMNTSAELFFADVSKDMEQLREMMTLLKSSDKWIKPDADYVQKTSPAKLAELVTKLSGHRTNLLKMESLMALVNPETAAKFQPVRHHYFVMVDILLKSGFIPSEDRSFGGSVKKLVTLGLADDEYVTLLDGFDPKRGSFADLDLARSFIYALQSNRFVNAKPMEVNRELEAWIRGTDPIDAAVAAIDQFSLSPEDNLAILLKLNKPYIEAAPGLSDIRTVYAHLIKVYHDTVASVDDSRRQVGSVRTSFITKADGTMKRFQSLIGEFETLMREVQMRSDAVLSQMKKK